MERFTNVILHRHNLKLSDAIPSNTYANYVEHGELAMQQNIFT